MQPLYTFGISIGGERDQLDAFLKAIEKDPGLSKARELFKQATIQRLTPSDSFHLLYCFKGVKHWDNAERLICRVLWNAASIDKLAFYACAMNHDTKVAEELSNANRPFYDKRVKALFGIENNTFYDRRALRIKHWIKTILSRVSIPLPVILVPLMAWYFIGSFL